MLIAALDPVTKSQIEIKLYRNVKNVPELRKKVISGEIQCCLVNPKLIFEPFQVIVAANKALTTENRTTKTIYTEILFNLSISKNITKSLQHFGVNDNCSDLLLVVLCNSTNSSIDVQGDEVDLKVLEEIRDLSAIRQAYKIKHDEEKSTSLLDSIVSRIATKDFISH